MSIVSSPRKLYVIGNGFDLHHGLPCGYADFRAWLQVNRPDVHRELIRLYGESDSDLWRDFEKGLSCFDLDNYPNDVKRADLVKLKDGLNEAFGGWVKTIGAPGKERLLKTSIRVPCSLHSTIQGRWRTFMVLMTVESCIFMEWWIMVASYMAMIDLPMIWMMRI